MKHLIKLFVITLSFSLAFCRADLSSDKAKYSYAIGQNIGKNIKSQNIDVDEKALTQGLIDALKGRTSSLSPQETKEAFNKLSQSQQKTNEAKGAVNTEAGKKYLVANKEKPGVITTASGLQYQILKKGTGKKPTVNSTVTVHYRGTLIDGKEFDSSYSRGKPAQFPVSGVIKGWTEGLQLMRQGAKYKFVIPGDLAYGPRGSGSIPPNSTLIFEVELIKVK